MLLVFVYLTLFQFQIFYEFLLHITHSPHTASTHFRFEPAHPLMNRRHDPTLTT